jgi:hypothetical protein
MQKPLFALVALVFCFVGLADVGWGQQPAPLPLAASASSQQEPSLTVAQQRARFAADQRLLRSEWNQWVGYEPLRPTVNASYMSNGVQRFYIPSRGVIVSSGMSRAWYW